MNKLTTTFLAISLGLISFAQKEKGIQQFNFHVGKNFSSFLYTNDAGEKDTNMTYTTGNQYGIGIGIALGSRHLVRPEVIYTEAGAKSSFQSTDLNWKMNYIGVGANYMFKLINDSSFSISPGIRIGYDYLLRGEQTIGNERYNIKENDALKAWDLNAGACLNGRFKITETLYLNAEYRFNTGLNQIEKKDEGEKTRNIAHSALLGLSFNL
jgi:hypothetical protein